MTKVYHDLQAPAKSYLLTYRVPNMVDQQGQPLEGRCSIRIWYHGETTYVVCTDVPGSNIFHNFNAETIANLVWQDEARPSAFVYVEQWIDRRLPPQYVRFEEQSGRLVDVSNGDTVEPDSFIGRVLAADYLEL